MYDFQTVFAFEKEFNKQLKVDFQVLVDQGYGT